MSTGCPQCPPRVRVWQHRPVAWEDELFALLDDLEGQAEAAYAEQRELELADRARAEYASVTLASRLMASVGATVTLEVRAVGRVEGVLERVAQGWCLVAAGGQDWLLPTGGVVAVAGASPRSVPEVAWSPLTRLGLGSALRRIADAGDRCMLHTLDGASYDVRLRRVGADFVEAVTGRDRELLLALDALAAVQRRD